MKYLHTMVRVTDLEQSLHFYRDLLGLAELRRIDNERGRFTLVFLAAPGNPEAQVELTYNWDPEAYTMGRAFGHLAYEVDDIYAMCARLAAGGWLMVEHGYDQADAVRALFAEAGFEAIESRRDLAGIPRIALGRLGSEP